MKHFIASLIGICLISGLYGQVQFKGVVSDSISAEPLALCVVSIAQEYQVANEEGEFQFNNLARGIYLVKFDFLGRIYSQSIVLNSDSLVLFEFDVPESLLHQLVVHAHEHDQDEIASIRYLISTSEMEANGAMSISEALRDVNGTNSLRTGFGVSKPILSGMHSNRISLLQSGTVLENQQWGQEHAPALDPLNGSRMEVIRGASTILYTNNAIGGLIRLIPSDFGAVDLKRMKVFSAMGSNPVAGQLGVQLESFNAAKKWGNRLSVNARKAGDSYSPDYVLSNTGVEQLSANFYSHIHLGPHQFSLSLSSFNQIVGILKASHIGNLSDLERALASKEPLIINPYTFGLSNPYQRINHQTAQLEYEQLHLALGDIQLSLSHQINDRKEFDNHSMSSTAALDLSLNSSQIRLYVDKHWSELRLEYGSIVERQENIFRGRYFIPNYRRIKYGIFTLLTYKLDKLLIELGARYDDQRINTYRYVKDVLTNDHLHFKGASFSLGARYVFNEQLNMLISGSRKFRAPGINELYSDGLHHGSASLEFGSLDLNEEIAYSLTGALSYINRRTQLRVEPYYHIFQGFINLEPTGESQLSIRGAFPVFRYIQSRAVYRGIDAQLKRELNDKWSAQLGASAVYAENLESGQFLFGIPAPNLALGLKRTFNPEELLKNAYIQIRSRYSFEHSWADLEQDFSRPPSGYLLLDLEFGRTVQALKGFMILRINNALNQRYRDYMNRYRYFADEQGIQIQLTYKYTLTNKPRNEKHI